MRGLYSFLIGVVLASSVVCADAKVIRTALKIIPPPPMQLDSLDRSPMTFKESCALIALEHRLSQYKETAGDTSESDIAYSWDIANKMAVERDKQMRR